MIAYALLTYPSLQTYWFYDLLMVLSDRNLRSTDNVIPQYLHPGRRGDSRGAGFQPRVQTPLSPANHPQDTLSHQLTNC